MKLLVLAKSKKHHNYCLAGLNLENNTFVRVLGSGDFGAFCDFDCKLDNGDTIEVLDSIEIDLKKEDINSAQTENYSCLSHIAIFKGKCSPDILSSIYLDVHFTNSFVKKSNYIGYLSRQNYETVSHSLELIKVKNLIITSDNICWFTYDGTSYAYVKVTDPKYLGTNRRYPNAYLLMSLSGEDSYTMRNNKFYMFVSSIFVI